jgi:hypothetical protein
MTRMLQSNPREDAQPRNRGDCDQDIANHVLTSRLVALCAGLTVPELLVLVSKKGHRLEWRSCRGRWSLSRYSGSRVLFLAAINFLADAVAMHRSGPSRRTAPFEGEDDAARVRGSDLTRMIPHSGQASGP